MFLKLSYRAVPILFLILCGLWTTVIYCPLFYSLASPNQEIQHLVGALEGRESARQELSALVQSVFDSSGKLQRAIQVGAYYGVSAEYKMKHSSTSKERQVSYLAWFEKHSRATVLVVTLTEIDGTTLHFSLSENVPMAVARPLLLPVFALALSVFWFRRSRRSGRREATAGGDASSS